MKHWQGPSKKFHWRALSKQARLRRLQKLQLKKGVRAFTTFIIVTPSLSICNCCRIIAN